jgi:hypothetical protein
MDDADKADHIQGLLHYFEAVDTWLSPVASAINLAGEGVQQEIDLKSLAGRGERVRS